jgi:hypothetical protein
MIINKEAALENLLRVCEESLGLIRLLVESQEIAYTAGYEGGMLAQSKVQGAIEDKVREQDS